MRRPWRRSCRRLRVALLLVVAVSICPLLGCRGQPLPTAREVLTAMQEAAALPPGEVYDSAAEPGTADALADSLLAALYGSATRGWAGEDDSPVVEAALFLSSRPEPAELAVFSCRDTTAALSVAAVCRERLSLLQHTWAGTDYAARVEEGEVTVAGNFVLLVVSPDTKEVLRAARDVI